MLVTAHHRITLTGSRWHDHRSKTVCFPSTPVLLSRHLPICLLMCHPVFKCRNCMSQFTRCFPPKIEESNTTTFRLQHLAFGAVDISDKQVMLICNTLFCFSCVFCVSSVSPLSWLFHSLHLPSATLVSLMSDAVHLFRPLYIVSVFPLSPVGLLSIVLCLSGCLP